jgi:hypothetical protein
MQSPNADTLSQPATATLLFDPKTRARQLHFLCEGHKRGLGFAELRQLVAQFYGPEIKPCQLHWTEIDRLIIELWRQDLRKPAQKTTSMVIDIARWRARSKKTEGR